MPRAAVLLSAAILALALTTISAHSEPEEKIDCANAMNTHDLNHCASKELEAADTELNAVYKRALAAIPGMASDEERYNAKSWEAALRASQRAWVAFRDAECGGHVPMFNSGGSATTAEVIYCEVELTQARTKKLKERYDDAP